MTPIARPSADVHLEGFIADAAATLRRVDAWLVADKSAIDATRVTLATTYRLLRRLSQPGRACPTVMPSRFGDEAA